MMSGGSFLIEIALAPEAGPWSRSLNDTILKRHDIAVWSSEPSRTIDARSVLIGQLFPRGAGTKPWEFSEGDDLAADKGRRLLSDYWGGYIFVHVGRNGTLRVFRDPSGALPCYVLRSADRLLVAGDITQLVEPGAGRVDFGEVARILSSGDARGRRTCLTGIDELVAGECLVVSDGALSVESWWAPWDHIICPSGAGFEDLAAAFRRTVQSTVGEWARSYSQILLGVSGGLDSSIVAAAAARANADIACLTLFGPDFDGDERRYASAMTDHVGLDLIEAPRAIEDIDIRRAPATNLPWPIVPIGRQTNEAIHARLLEERPIDAFFSGNGGDAVLCSLRSAVPFIDRVLAEGPSPRLATTLLDVCLLTGADRRTVLRHAWDRYRQERGRHRIRYNLAGLTRSAAKHVRSVAVNHPWLSPPPDVLPGKTVHAAYLMRAQKSIELYPRAASPPHVAPLISQPVMELCLSIPTWMWVAGGRNRAVARHAFDAELPPTILQRTQKGGPGGFDLLIYRGHRQDLHEWLRRGLLVQNDIFDPAFLDNAEDPSWRGVERIQRILEFAAAESWVRWWAGA